MKRRFLSIEIITYLHGSKNARPANPPPNLISHTASSTTPRFMLQTLVVGLVLGALWGIRLLKRSPAPLDDTETLALQKQQERDDRTNRWISELEQNMSEENNDE